MAENKPEREEFENRDELEKAYHAGKLRRGVNYYVKSKNTTYRLSPCRGGFFEVNNQ